MRLLYLNHNVAGTGTYQRAFNLGREMVRRGHEVTLVTTSRSGRLRFRVRDADGVRVLEAPDLWWGPARTGWDPWNTVRRTFRLGASQFDLIHAFDSRPAVIVPALAIRRRTRPALVMDWADWWGRGGIIRDRSGWPVRTFFGPVETWFEEAFRTRADATTVISSALEERARRLGVSDPILRFPNGCEPPRGDTPERLRARGLLELDRHAPLLVHLGVLTRGDMELLSRALRLLRQDVPSARLALVGHPSVTPPPSLVASGAILPTGYVSQGELRLWLAAADLCVLPLRATLSNASRWPGRLNEYLSAGRPTVMTRVGDAAGYLERHGAGWTCEPGPEALAGSLAGALRDAAGRHAAGSAARRLATGELAWERIAELVERFYVDRGAGTPAERAERATARG